MLRSLQFILRCKTSLELVFAIWFVMGNVWVFDTRLGSYQRAPKLHVLCIMLLAWNAVTYSFPFILFVLLCCCVPLLSTLLGYNMNTASLSRGATDEHLSSLPSWRYKDVGSVLEQGISPNNHETPVCLVFFSLWLFFTSWKLVLGQGMTHKFVIMLKLLS